MTTVWDAATAGEDQKRSREQQDMKSWMEAQRFGMDQQTLAIQQQEHQAKLAQAQQQQAATARQEKQAAYMAIKKATESGDKAYASFLAQTHFGQPLEEVMPPLPPELQGAEAMNRALGDAPKDPGASPPAPEYGAGATPQEDNARIFGIQQSQADFEQQKREYEAFRQQMAAAEAYSRDSQPTYRVGAMEFDPGASERDRKKRLEKGAEIAPSIAERLRQNAALETVGLNPTDKAGDEILKNQGDIDLWGRRGESLNEGKHDAAKLRADAQVEAARLRSEATLSAAKVRAAKQAGSSNPEAFDQFVAAAGELQPGEAIPPRVALLGRAAGLKPNQVALEVERYRSSGNKAVVVDNKAHALDVNDPNGVSGTATSPVAKNQLDKSNVAFDQLRTRMGALIAHVEKYGPRLIDPNLIQERESLMTAAGAQGRVYNQLGSTDKSQAMERMILGPDGTPNHGLIVGANVDVLKHVLSEAEQAHRARTQVYMRPQQAQQAGSMRDRIQQNKPAAKSPVKPETADDMLRKALGL